MTKEVINKVEAKVGPYIEKKCRGYAAKYGWSEEYTLLAIRCCKRGAARAVRNAEVVGEKIVRPVNFCKYEAMMALKRDKTGRLIIPIWKKEMRTGSGIVVSYADSQEML